LSARKGRHQLPDRILNARRVWRWQNRAEILAGRDQVERTRYNKSHGPRLELSLGASGGRAGDIGMH
jgi:hypothetical protein